MHILDSIESFRDWRKSVSGTVSFVPTMGALHPGHMDLMRIANENADHLVVSIFVNPMQFDRSEDLNTYPADRAGDLEKCESMGCEAVFYPTPQMMYPKNGSDQPTYVDVADLGDTLCGSTRPGHFRGVSTVVAKLFNIVQPDVAVFGQKDYQQLAIIQQMTSDLNFPVQVIGGPTVRHQDGLAVSSRNYNIPAELRPKAAAMSRGMGKAWKAYQNGERNAEVLEDLVLDRLRQEGLRPDYAECVHPQSLIRFRNAGLKIGPEGAVVAAAAFIGPVRIIDNVVLGAPLPKEIMVED